MQAKGTALKAAREFVRQKYGSEGLDRWLAALPQKTREIYGKSLLSSAWYPYTEGLDLPLKGICDLFYQGRLQGAWEEGRFCAGSDLRGIYRAFVKVATPNMLVRNSALIFGSYFQGATLAVKESAGRRIVTHLRTEDQPSRYFDHNVAGWMESALELCGCKGLAVAIGAAATDNGTHTEIVMTWD